MSAAAEVAAIDAIAAALRAGFANPALTIANCDWQPDGKPPPNAPALYISIDEDGVVSDGDRAQGFVRETQRYNIWISVRSGDTPYDQRSQIYRRASQPLTGAERQIINLISGVQSVRNAANANLAAGDAIFQNPLYYVGRSKTEIKDSGWSTEGDNTAASGWVVRKLPFIGFRRIYYIGNVL